MTNPTLHGQVPAIQRYKIGYHSDEWGVRSSTPSGIPDASGSWVRYEDHALRAAQPAVAQQPGAAYAALPDVDALAQEIRRVDGAHKLGAGALAEALMPFLRASHGQAPADAKALAEADRRAARAPADSVQEDAARYRFLRDGEWRDTDLEPFIRLQLNTLWDAKIDAARAAQEGKSHE